MTIMLLVYSLRPTSYPSEDDTTRHIHFPYLKQLTYFVFNLIYLYAYLLNE